jgi:hypothetical protein
MEAAADEQEFFAIHELKPHVDFVSVQGAIERESGLARIVEK